MQHLEVSGVVRPIYGLLGVKRLMNVASFFRTAFWRTNLRYDEIQGTTMDGVPGLKTLKRNRKILTYLQ
jgi:hypothetical protein